MTSFRTGIFLTGALGDFINALPALYALRQAHPASEITLIGNPLWLPLARLGNLIDDGISMESLPLHIGFQANPVEPNKLYHFLKKFDLIISWFGDREGQWKKNLQRATRGDIHVYPFHQYRSFPGHVSDYYLDTLGKIGLYQLKKPPSPWLQVKKEPFYEDSFLCLQPGSGSPPKNWPKENYLKIAQEVARRRNRPTHILLGPAEIKNQESYWETVKDSSVKVYKNLPILEAAGRLSLARLFLGNDSGISHLAAALGVPTITLFGPTDPHRWAPAGRHVTIIRKDEPCSPCREPAACLNPEQRCLEKIVPEEVLWQIEEVAKTYE